VAISYSATGLLRLLTQSRNDAVAPWDYFFFVIARPLCGRGNLRIFRKLKGV